MEYDPAFPTGDHVKKKKKHKKNVSTIPLPGAPTSLLEIPMPMFPIEDVELPPEPPPMYLDVPLPSTPAEVPLPSPPSIPFPSAMALPEVKSTIPQPPVKFQMKVSSKPAATNDNADTSKPLTSSISSLSGRPTLKVGNSLVKRMRAGVLPTGVLSGRKKPIENEGAAPPPPVVKEVERFVPPTVNASAATVDPSLTLSSNMLDAAKRAISQINSALLGMPNTPEGSSGGAASGAVVSASALHPGQPLITASSPQLPDTGMNNARASSSPAPKRRRSRSLSARSGPRASKPKKQRYHSSSSSSSSSGQSRRRRRRRRTRSARGRRRRSRSGNRRRRSRSRDERRRRNNAKDRSRSPPQSRRGRSRSLRKALSPSNSASSYSSYSSESSESTERSAEKGDTKAEKKRHRSEEAEEKDRRRKGAERAKEETKEKKKGERMEKREGDVRQKDRKETEERAATKDQREKRNVRDQDRDEKDRKEHGREKREKDRYSAKDAERRDKSGGKGDRTRDHDRNQGHRNREERNKEGERRGNERQSNKEAVRNGEKEKERSKEDRERNTGRDRKDPVRDKGRRTEEKGQSREWSVDRNGKKNVGGDGSSHREREHRGKTGDESADREGNRRTEAKGREGSARGRPERPSLDRAPAKPVVLQHLKEELDDEDEGNGQADKVVKPEFSQKSKEERKERKPSRHGDRSRKEPMKEETRSSDRQERTKELIKEKTYSPDSHEQSRKEPIKEETCSPDGHEQSRKETIKEEIYSPDGQERSRKDETRSPDRHERSKKESKDETSFPDRHERSKESKDETGLPDRHERSKESKGETGLPDRHERSKELKDETGLPDRHERSKESKDETGLPDRHERSKKESVKEESDRKEEIRTQDHHERSKKGEEDQTRYPDRNDRSRKESKDDRGKKKDQGHTPDRYERSRKEPKDEPSRLDETRSPDRHERRKDDRGRQNEIRSPNRHERGRNDGKDGRGRQDETRSPDRHERRNDGKDGGGRRDETRSPDRHERRKDGKDGRDRQDVKDERSRRKDPARSPDRHDRNRKESKDERSRKNDARSPDRHERSRKDGGHSPDRHERNKKDGGHSPDRHERSRKDGGHSPDRHERNRKDGGHSPDRHERNRKDGGHSPDRHERNRKDGGHSPDRHERSRKDDGRSPDRHERSRKELKDERSRKDDGRSPERHNRSRKESKDERSRKDDGRSPDRHDRSRKDDSRSGRHEGKRGPDSEDAPESKRRSVNRRRSHSGSGDRKGSRMAGGGGYKTLKEEAEERAQRRKEELRRKERRELCEDGRRRKERRRSHSHSPPPPEHRREDRVARLPSSGAERHERTSERHERGPRDRHHDGRSPTRHRRPRSPSSSPPPPRRDPEPEPRKEQSAEFLQILKKFDDFFNALSNMSTRPEAPAAEQLEQRGPKPLRDARPRHRRRKSASAASSSSSSAMSVSGGSSPGVSPAPRKAPPKHPAASTFPQPSSSVQHDWSAEGAEPHPDFTAFNYQQPWPHDGAPFDAHHPPYPQAFGHEAFSSISNPDYQQFLFQQAQQQQQHHQQQQQMYSMYEQPPPVGSSWQASFHPPCPTPLVPHADFGPQLGIPPLMQQDPWPAQLSASQPPMTPETAMHDSLTNGAAAREAGYPEPLRISMEGSASFTSGAPTSGAIIGIGPSTPPTRENGQDDDDDDDDDVRQEEGEEEDEEDLEDEEEEEEEGSVCAEGGAGSELEVELGEGDHPSLAPDDLSSIGDKELEMAPKHDDDSGSWNERGRVGPRTPALEELYPDAPKPVYEHIEENEFRSRSLMRSRSKLETNRWVCDCTVPNPDEAAQGMKPCGEDCINRVLNIECGSRCPIAELCTNRQFQEKRMAPVEPFYAGPEKGWGLRARDRIPPGTFVIEYVGEVIDFREFKRRIVSYERDGHAHHYFMALEADTFADAGTKGNWARFVNHSCEPNAETQKWNVLGQIRIGFFTKRPIDKGEEITIDYQFVQFGRTEQKCYCGTPSCTGVMGSTSKQLQEKVRLRDTRQVERRFAKLLSLEALKNAEDVQLLLKVLVQEYLLRDARFDLLALVLRTESEACLKMFRQYNGLELLASYMRDSDTTDWAMKQRLLEVLDKIPVMEQKQLRSGTNLFSIVRQWAVDPRFCRQRATLSAAQSSGSGSGKGGDSVVPSPATTATTNEDGEPGEAQEVGSIGPGVDLETGEKTGPESDLDQQATEQLRELAQRLLNKWEQLPDEIYRIPKVERHETEQLLQPAGKPLCQRASVLSSSQRAPLVSWGLEKKRPASPPAKAPAGLGSGTPRLPKDEFRRLFEAYVRFEEEQKKLSEEQKKLSEQRKQHEIDLSKIHDPSLQDAVEKIRQLLSRTLLHAIEQLKRGMQPQLVLPPDLTEVAQDEKVQRLLGELQHVEMSQLLTLLSGCDGPGAEGSMLAGERGGSALLTAPGLPGPEEQLPPNWKWARDTDGRLYFYHVLTKKTQWEAPLYPWDAGEEDPEAYCYNNAYLFQVTHEEVAAMNVRIQRLLKDKAKAQKAHRKKAAKRAARKEANWEEKHRARFHKQMYKIIASHLHKYRSQEVRLGRITSSADLKYLGKKLSLTILHKEMKAVRTIEDLEVNANVTSKAIAYVDKYMSGRGAVYMRHGTARRGSNTMATPSQRSLPEEAKTAGPVTPGPEPKEEEALCFPEEDAGSSVPQMADEELKELDGLL